MSSNPSPIVDLMFGEIRRIMKSGKGAPRKRLVVCVLHIVLWPLFLIPRLFWPRRRPSPLSGSCRILLLRVDGIGDLTMTSTIFPSLRRRFPEARIDLLTSDAARPLGELFVAAGWLNCARALPLVGRTLLQYLELARELASTRYDAAVDLRGDMRNILLMWFAGISQRVGMPATGLTYLLTDIVDLPHPHHQADEAAEMIRRLGVTDIDALPDLPLRAQDLADADRWLADHGAVFGRPICAFHLGAFFPTKIWPLERFVGVAKHLRQTLDAQFVVVGSKAEKELGAAFAAEVGGGVMLAVGEVSLILSAAILSRCAVLVGNDSGPAHVASAVGRPVVVLFGRGDAQMYRPLSSKVVILQSTRPCDVNCDKFCVRPETRCMLDHTVHTVAPLVEAIVRKSMNET